MESPDSVSHPYPCHGGWSEWDGSGEKTLEGREDIKNLTILADTIVSGRTFSKVISPFKLLAHAPIKDRYTDKPIISPGIMPNGKNGIHLVIMQNGKEIIEEMSVNIQEKEAQ